MMVSALKSLARIIKAILVLVILVGIITAVFAYFAEKHLAVIRGATYTPESLAVADSLEGGYWWLDSIEDTTGVHNHYADIMRLRKRLPEETTFAYSFKDNVRLDMDPLWITDEDDVEEKQRLYEGILAYWREHCAKDYSILKSVLPVLMESYERMKYGEDQSYESFLESLGVPVPSMQVVLIEKYPRYHQGDSLYAPIPGLRLISVDTQSMVLFHPGSKLILHYGRLSKLPQPLAPATVYFAQRDFYSKYRYDEGIRKARIITDEKINEHFEDLFK